MCNFPCALLSMLLVPLFVPGTEEVGITNDARCSVPNICHQEKLFPVLLSHTVSSCFVSKSWEYLKRGVTCLVKY